MTGSKPLHLNKNDLLSIGKGAGIAMLGALATYVVSILGDLEFGVSTPIVVAILSILVNAIRKFIADNK